MSVGTAFHPREAQLNVKLAWDEWSGYLAAAVYADFHDIEYNAIREAAAVIDVSPAVQVHGLGPRRRPAVDRVSPRDAAPAHVDQVYYTFWCDEDGKIIDDGTVARLDETTYRITAALRCLRWFMLNATGLDVEIDDVTETTAALALQGMLSREVLQAATGQDWSDVPYFGRRRATIAGVPVDVTRTGYTGDLGYELWVTADEALDVWDALFEAGRDYAIRPHQRACPRRRARGGRPDPDRGRLHQRDGTRGTPTHRYSPFELGLGGWSTSTRRGLRRRRARSRAAAGRRPAAAARRTRLDWSGIEGMFGRHGLAPEVSAMVHPPAVPISREGRQVGRATSICWGPTIKKMVGFGSVEPGLQEPGTMVSVEWSVEGEHGKVAATVVPMPFLNLARKRT